MLTGFASMRLSPVEVLYHYMRGRPPCTGGGLPLPALDEFDNVAIGIFDHGNGSPGPDRGFGPREGNVLGFQPLDHLVQIGDDKGQVAKAELLVDADGARARPVRGVDELDITGAKAQAMHGAGGGLVDADFGEPEQVVIKVQARVNIPTNDPEINRVFGRLHHRDSLLRRSAFKA